MSKVQELECPSCGAPLKYDEKKGMYCCEYCGNTMLVDDEYIRRYRLENRRLDREQQEFDYSIKKDKEYEEKRAKWEKLRTRWFAALGIIFAMLFFSDGAFEDLLIGLWLALIIFGGAALHYNKPKAPLTGQAVRRAAQRAADQDTAYTGRGIPVNNFASGRSKPAALILCIFLGWMGAHYFYVGKWFYGLVYFFTFGFGGIGWVVDIIRIACGSFTDRNGLPLIS